MIQVAFADWTHGGILRQPRYLGLRQDRDPEDRGARGTGAYGGRREEDADRSAARRKREAPARKAGARGAATTAQVGRAAPHASRPRAVSRTTASPSCSWPSTSPPWAKPPCRTTRTGRCRILRNTHGSTAVFPEAFSREVGRRPARRADSECRQGSGLRGLRFARRPAASRAGRRGGTAQLGRA